MKIAIINPNLLGSISGLDMGIAYTATYIDERTTHNVKIVDLSFHRRTWKRYMRKKLKEFNPDVIGISIVSPYFDYSKRVAKEVRRYCDKPIIVGGHHPTLKPEECIAVHEFDAAIIGDGEYTITECLDRLERGESLKGVEGIWFKENGLVTKNEKRAVIADIDSLPIPNYDLWEDLDKYFYYMQRLYFYGVRGCAYACTYCNEFSLSRVNKGKRYRMREPREYAREMKYQFEKYKDRGMVAGHIFDAIFTFDHEWLAEFSDEYKKLGLAVQLPYTCFIKADKKCSKEEDVKLLAESGCLQVRFGLESGSEYIRRKIMLKGASTNEEIIDYVKLYKKYGLVTKCYNILGCPGEKKEDIMATYNLNKEVGVEYPIFFTYIPLPGTAMAEMAESVNEESKYSFHFGEAIKLEGVPKNFVTKVQRKCYMYFMPRVFWRVFKNNPFGLLRMLIPRIIRALIIGAKTRIVIGYTLNSPYFWKKQAIQNRIQAEKAGFVFDTAKERKDSSLFVVNLPAAQVATH